MWWQFYTDLSVKVIDHLLDYVSPASDTAPPVSLAEQECSHQLKHMLRNINEEMQVISEQHRKMIRAELASHARTLCLSEISHDLRTPLNAIIGFTQLMESGIFGSIDNKQYNDYLRYIRESGYELLERIEELLNTAPEGAPPSSKRPAPVREFAA